MKIINPTARPIDTQLVTDITAFMSDKQQADIDDFLAVHPEHNAKLEGELQQAIIDAGLLVSGTMGKGNLSLVGGQNNDALLNE